MTPREKKAMTNLSKSLRTASFGLAIAGCIIAAGLFSEASAQRDPFTKPGYMKTRTPPSNGSGSATPGKSGSSAPVNYGPPAIDSRIEYFKRQREIAASNGSPLPKVTSVLTLDEMDVTGIFKTPRGYAAMVEAIPIKLSYTIYPGEKFFDGQLVAVEENRLVFRKVVKTGPNKFVASVENKPLKEYTMRAQIEGTAPIQATDKPVQTASSVSPTSESKPATGPIVSPLDEMNDQTATPEKTKAKKASKKPVKIAKNGRK